MKKFHLGDILSITGNKLVSLDGISGVYAILNFMTGESLFTHQLLRAREVAKPHLLQQHSFLGKIDDTSVNRDNWKEWLAAQVSKFGQELDVQPLPAGAYAVKDPIAEACELVGEDKVIVVEVDKGCSCSTE